jgi:CheY-like chemotaxis protein
MSVIRLIHWNADEARQKAEKLRAAGYEVACEPFDAAGLRQLKENPPAAVLIDLGRLPSQGRDVGLALRKTKATRQVPLVFVRGEPEKVDRVRELLPDAVYTTWRGIRGALKRAVAWPPADPVTPRSVMAGYSGAPLMKKLGIKPGWTVALVDAPEGIEEILGELPEEVTLRRGARGRCDLALYFPESRADLERRIARLGALPGQGGLWVVWPKKSSGVASDLTQPIVRKIGLAAGLVDYKVCSVDATWTGLRFARRRGAS